VSHPKGYVAKRLAYAAIALLILAGIAGIYYLKIRPETGSISGSIYGSPQPVVKPDEARPVVTVEELAQQIKEAKAYEVAGSVEAKHKALLVYREAAKKISKDLINSLDAEMLSTAVADDKQGLNDDALRKYSSVFSRWLRQAKEGQVVVTISDPAQDGVEVGLSKTVKGEASIPSGHHVWVLVHRVDFKGMWWPQGEGVIDPKTKEWKVQVTFGEAVDVGRDFEIAAIAVNNQEHICIRDCWETAMTTNNWTPIKMPPTVGAPKIVKVKKTSHNN
jgi:hypothetical protein